MSPAKPRRALQRDVVAATARASERVFTVDELASSVRRAGRRVGLATVYRAVSEMVERGELQPVGERGGKRLYAACGVEEHHHHAVCTACGSVTHADCPLPLGSLRAAPGFRVTAHDLTLYGVCRECGAKTKGG